LNETLAEQLEGLLEKYSELLIGDATNENKEKVRAWILYNHIAKSMPQLAKHWNATYPDAKVGIMEVIKEIKELNEQAKKNENH
jgi:hypothetical protein